MYQYALSYSHSRMEGASHRESIHVFCVELLLISAEPPQIIETSSELAQLVEALLPSENKEIAPYNCTGMPVPLVRPEQPSARA